MKIPPRNDDDDDDDDDAEGERRAGQMDGFQFSIAREPTIS